ncbi:MAG: efflux RND transporter periplasmic adaptor subunit [Kiritimatiellae bacterium]|nr:efflux RND transporter periplasmic adaptor subunit [Kiritimatiellia bacterium]
MKKLALPVLVVLLALPALADDPAPAPAVPAVAVRVTPVATRTFERRLAVQGTLQAKTFAQVSARTTGIIDDMFVDEGDTVKKGDRLFQIDPTRVSAALVIASNNFSVANAQLAVAEASAAKTRAEARKAQLDYDRYARLHADGKVTDNEFEARDVANAQAAAGIAVADAQVELARRQADAAAASVAIAQKDFDDALALAPIDGAVVTRAAEPGELAAAGRVLLRIEDPSRVEASAFLPARYYAAATPAETSFRVLLEGRDLGTFPLTYRSPVIDPTLRTFEIRGDVSGDGAVPGADATLQIVFSAHEGLAVPTSAILDRAGGKAVYVAADGLAQLVPVTLGLDNDGFTEILSGLSPDSPPVVTAGQSLLNPGSPLQILD